MSKVERVRQRVVRWTWGQALEQVWQPVEQQVDRQVRWRDARRALKQVERQVWWNARKPVRNVLKEDTAWTVSRR